MRNTYLIEITSSGGLLRTRYWNFNFHKSWGISDYRFDYRHLRKDFP